MTKITQYRYFNLMLHVLFWSIALLFPYFISSADNQYRIGPHPGLYFTLSGVIHMILFYSNTLFFYPKLLNKTYWWLYITVIALLIVISVQVKLYLLAWWFPNDLQNVRSHLLFPSLLAFIVSIFYSITREKIQAEKLQKEKEALQLGMELKFLRSQISPHFLFNVLTNLVSLARKRSDHLETSLLMLSGLMRYMLYNTDRKITLQQEMEYLESYITLQKLRFGRDVNITFNTEIAPDELHYCMDSMLLLPFVENAFKHGTGYVDQPLIDIRLTAKGGLLLFRVINKFDRELDTVKDDNSGIGLSNVRSRLALLYPGRHELVIQSDNNLFDINLTMKLT